MKIVMFNARADVLAGIAEYIEAVTTGMIARGHEVVIVTGEGIWTDRLRARGFAIEVIDTLGRNIAPGKDIPAQVALLRLMRRLRPDLLATHGAKAGAMGRLAGLLLRTPVVYSPHAWAFDAGPHEAGSRRFLTLERILAKLPGRIVAVSDYERRVGLDHGIGKPGDYDVIHNGIADVAEALRAHPASEPPTMVMVARFEPQKDHETLLKAVARLDQTGWRLDLVGDGPLMPEMQALASRLGVTDRVRFRGHREDVAELLAGAQVFVMLSHWESFPLSILEAMRAGLPCIVSDVGGNREAVADATTGVLVQDGDIAGVAGAVSRMVDDADHRVALGSAGRERFVAQFGGGVMLQRLEDLYTSLIR